MKTTLLSILMALMVPTVSMAKVDGFNAMITENGKAQQQLRKDLNQQMEVTRQAQSGVKNEITGDGGFMQSFNSPTDKGFMTFKKETVHYRASEEKQMERLATEISDLEASF
jgi:hypothetical protein